MLNVTNSTPDDLLKAGVNLQNAGDFAGAEQLYRQLLARDPRNTVAMHLLGQIALHAGNVPAALDLLETSVAASPEYAGARCSYGRALAAAGRVDDAVLQFRLAGELDPQAAEPRQSLDRLAATHNLPPLQDPASPDPAFGSHLVRVAGEIAARTPGAAAAAVHLYERALEQNPDQPAVLAAMGWLLLKIKQPQEAVEAFKAALAMKHVTADVYHGLAQALHKKFDFQEALSACNEALRLEPANFDIQWTQTQIQADIHKFDVAATNIRAALAKDPANQDLQFQLRAITGDRSLGAMPSAQVASTFDRYAATFDSHLLGKLNYKGPQILFDVVTRAAPGRTFDILDLGCGTGLCGAVFKPLARRLDGVDLSPRMIERSRERAIYDRLEVADVLSALKAAHGQYDLITAADVFTYIGDLDEIFAAATDALRPGGLFVFWVERTDESKFLLNRNTFRFTHNLVYLLELGEKHGLMERAVDETPTRRQFGRPVPAWTVLLHKPGG